MPLIKANEPLPESPVIIFFYGEPGVGKTTLANTANRVLLIDADRGVDRSKHRQDTLVVSAWEEIVAEETKGTFNDYKTIVIDTPKALLDDFLMSYVCKMDARLRTNKLKAYGAIGDEFKLFVNNRRVAGQDLVLVAHAKTEEDGDFKQKLPDVTGQSYGLLMRIADQVGYLSTVNNVRTLSFEPTDKQKGKNVAKIPALQIPAVEDPAFLTFFNGIIEQVRAAKREESAAQAEAVKRSQDLQASLQQCETPEKLTETLVEVQSLPIYLAAPLKVLIKERANSKGWIANKELKRFEIPAAGQPVAPDPEPPAPGAGSPAPIIFTSVDERSKELEAAGALIAGEGFNYGADGRLFMSWDELAVLSEDDFTELLKTITTKTETPKASEKAKPKPKPKPQAAQ